MSGKNNPSSPSPAESPRSKDPALLAAAQNAPAAASQRLVSFVKNIFADKKKKQDVVISNPFDVSHDHHVEFDEETGFTVRWMHFTILLKIVYFSFFTCVIDFKIQYTFFETIYTTQLSIFH